MCNAAELEDSWVIQNRLRFMSPSKRSLLLTVITKCPEHSEEENPQRFLFLTEIITVIANFRCYYFPFIYAVFLFGEHKKISVYIRSLS